MHNENANHAMPSARIVPGQRFHRLTAVRKEMVCRSGKRRSEWLCLCDCGNQKLVRPRALLLAKAKSCGCLRAELYKGVNPNFKHGMERSPTYKSWQGMLNRCRNPKCQAYPDYGGRGIKVCERWFRSFENFLADMGERPPMPDFAGTPTSRRFMSLDRIDPNGDYEPSNCRWADNFTQTNNTRNSVRVKLDGVTMTIREAMQKAGKSRTYWQNRAFPASS